MIRLRRRVAVVLLAAIGSGGVVAGPSTAGTVNGNNATLNARAVDGAVTLVISPKPDAEGVVPEFQGTPAGVSVKINGQPVEAETSAASTDLNRTVIIGLDVSGSMKDKVRGASGPTKITSAKNAIKDFLAELPDDFKVGLVEFGDNAKTTVAPGDRAAVLAQVEELEAKDDDTHLYQGVAESVKALELAKTDSPWLVLLSDGKSEGGDVDESDATNALKSQAEAGLHFFPIAFGQDADRPGLLRLAKAGGSDTFLEAENVEDLNTAFDSAQTAASNSLTFTTPVPAGAKDALRIEWTGTVGGQQYQAESLAVLTGQAPVAAPVASAPIIRSDGGGWVQPPVLYGSLVALFLALVAILAIAGGVFTTGGGRESEVMRRLSFYTVNPRDPRRISLTEQTTEEVGGSPLKRSAVTLLGRLLRDREMVAGLDARLDAAGLPLRTAEWMLLHIGVTVGTAFVFLLLGRGTLIAAVVGLLIGFAIPWFVLSIRTSRRRSAFLAQLPDTLQALASSLRAGYSLPQAMDAVVQESAPPISTEFSRSLVETRLGMPAEDALEAIADRTASKDFSWIVMAIRIQRQVGGNLAELLNSVAETLRERERLRGQVRALSAEGRLSAWILGLLPVVFTAYLLVAQPAYLEPMFSTTLGLLLLGFGATLVLLGSLWMRKVVTVEV